MKLKFLLAAAALGFTSIAMAQGAMQRTTLVEAYEVAPSTLRLPQVESGTISYRPCPECDFQTTRVTTSTRWLVDDRAVTLDRFREVFNGLEDRDSAFLVVSHHLKSNLVRDVRLSTR